MLIEFKYRKKIIIQLKSEYFRQLYRSLIDFSRFCNAYSSIFNNALVHSYLVYFFILKKKEEKKTLGTVIVFFLFIRHYLRHEKVTLQIFFYLLFCDSQPSHYFIFFFRIPWCIIWNCIHALLMMCLYNTSNIGTNSWKQIPIFRKYIKFINC